ncbi:MAG: hypothetical protein F4103_13950 [Boseongicola sp. SB0673_bin_14]|nr:hypothetical protein [Boseongicola sp. SB0673_bin_14]
MATVKRFGKASLVPIAGNEENGHEIAFADPGTDSCQGRGGRTVPRPDGINIRVLEDNATDFHLVLPPAGRNLSDQEISGVAGGIGDIDTW